MNLKNRELIKTIIFGFQDVWTMPIYRKIYFRSGVSQSKQSPNNNSNDAIFGNGFVCFGLFSLT